MGHSPLQATRHVRFAMCVLLFFERLRLRSVLCMLGPRQTLQCLGIVHGAGELPRRHNFESVSAAGVFAAPVVSALPPCFRSV